MTSLLIILAALNGAMIVFFMVVFIRSFTIYKPSKFTNYNKSKPIEVLAIIVEGIITLVAPVVGFIRNSNISSGEFPFAKEHQLILIILIAIAVITFWLSKFLKGKLSPMLDAFLPIGLLMGIILSLVMIVHFGLYTILATIFPIAGFEITAVFLVLLAFIRELYFNHLHFKMKYQPTRINDNFANHKLFKVFLQSKFINKFPVLFIFSFFIIAILQAILTLFGQAPDSMIRVFYESCGFMLSHSQSCYSGGHYLCTVAAHGDKKLVKPIRYGLRNDKKIIVNRQLLVANAFENWLENNSPKFQLKVRKLYDSLNIPVRVWARKKKTANFIYLVMKPLEWMFIFWLYLMDKNPENRIAMQYLPKSIKNK